MKACMLSSVYGEIMEVLVVFPGVFTDASAEEYVGITNAFHPRRKVHQFLLKDPDCTIMVGRSLDRSADIELPQTVIYRTINKITANLDLPAMLTRWKDELTKIANRERLTYHRWAQDPFVTMVGNDAIILLQSYSSQRMLDFLLPLQLAELAGAAFLLKPTRLCLEGGNMLCDRDRAYIGKDLILKNQALLAMGADQVVAQFQQALGVSEVMVIGATMERLQWPPNPNEGTTWQPFFHIDLFMTLGGIGSMDSRRLVFLGNTELCLELLQSAQAFDPKIKLPEMAAGVGEGLTEVRVGFDPLKFLVVDLPIFCFNYVCYSWNNCLVEIFADVRRVYLPSYITQTDDECFNASFLVLEAEVERQFVLAGFEVVWIRTGRFFRIIASHGGSLHCVTKVLRRRAEA